LTFVPQQLWEPQKYFCGTVTICLHINEQDDELFKRIKAHLISGAEVVPFSSALERKIKNTDMLVNILYKVFFILRRFLKVHKLKNHFRMILKI
ncbi:MAG: hypothetical protein Q7S39_03220, partial [Ignavibacteria bacterium]|nr:hypothetical protein [Ignavibacteria bacterium]